MSFIKTNIRICVSLNLSDYLYFFMRIITILISEALWCASQTHVRPAHIHSDLPQIRNSEYNSFVGTTVWGKRIQNSTIGLAETLGHLDQEKQAVNYQNFWTYSRIAEPQVLLPATIDCVQHIIHKKIEQTAAIQ